MLPKLVVKQSVFTLRQVRLIVPPADRLMGPFAVNTPKHARQ